MSLEITTLLTKTTAAQNEDALSYYRVRGLYFQAVVFVAAIYMLLNSAIEPSPGLGHCHEGDM